MKHQFYSLRVQGGKEQKIKEKIEKVINASKKLKSLFTAIHLMPYEKMVINKKGKKEFREKYLSYLYIEGDCTDPSLREAIVQVEGVFGWVGAERPSINQEPLPIKPEEMDAMSQKISQRHTSSTKQPKFKEGDKIIVKDEKSVFKGRTGEIIEIIKTGEIIKSLQIGLNIFGGKQQVAVTLAPNKVELAPQQKQK